MGIMVLDNASKLEVTRRGLAKLLADFELIRNALNQDCSSGDRSFNEAREALGRVDTALAEMKEAVETQGT